MNFIVIIEGVPGAPPIPPEEWLELAKANLEWVKTLKASGRAEAAYALADHAGGFMGGFGIVDYDSAEQLAADLATMPVAGLSTTKMHPLIGFETLEKFIEETLKSLPRK